MKIGAIEPYFMWKNCHVEGFLRAFFSSFKNNKSTMLLKHDFVKPLWQNSG